MCTHEKQYLIGTAQGIRCRLCGMTWASFDDMRPRPAARKPATKKTTTTTPKKGGRKNA